MTEKIKSALERMENIVEKVKNADCLVANEPMQALTHYHTIPHFDTSKICNCGKHCEKRRNCL